ncbi:hypothetical protein PP409_gp04 [Vibrio phage Seahorse]|uniref:Uncharacterized protein n=1 Tax=Vibrio phage Seahorse TaxID=2662136 RepID=A0A6B7SF15_9CAUD|nr:hypothetical protein PP409_gp04 [Vibrio phage Seahorse]QGF21017.1 hypothetical protein [Vibrio phage Seahorse]
MITAKEARSISGPSISEQVEELLQELEKSIKASAERKNREVTIKREPFARWALSESNRCEVGRQVFEALTDLGYETDTYYYEGQFVDYGLIIRW